MLSLQSLQLSEKDEELRRQSLQLSEKDTELKKKDEELRQKDEEIATLKALVTELEPKTDAFPHILQMCRFSPSFFIWATWPTI